MEFLGFGQVAVNVEDLDSAMKDYVDVFGMKFDIVNADFINMRVAVSDGGLVLCEETGAEDDARIADVKAQWNGALSAIELRVDDIEQARELLEAKGCRTLYYMGDEKTGFREYLMSQFHGIAITVFQMDTDSWVEAIEENIAAPPSCDWIDAGKT